jgi:serine protease AprX
MVNGRRRFLALGVVGSAIVPCVAESMSVVASGPAISASDRRASWRDDDPDDEDDEDDYESGAGIGDENGDGDVLGDEAGGDGDDDDPEDVVGYDDLPPNVVWRDVVGLPAGGDIDGSAVTVAVIDTGVTRVPELGDRVVARMDLTPDADGYDRFGHGTHMVGLVAGEGVGVAPGATVVSVKVAGWDGATDPSAVLAGLEWVAAHHEQYGIRVVNVSYGTDSSQKYLDDPLDFAVERLWEEGIAVVAAAGNRGDGGSKIDKPGDDPLVITVGAADVNGTVSGADDTVAAFSSCGPTHDSVAKPDLLAPGIGILSSRAPDSTIDALRPAARFGNLFKGSGTSQATAIVSGIAALMLEVDPGLTPDEVKATLVATASADLAGQPCAGAGVVHAGRAVQAAAAGTFAGARLHDGIARASGLGSIDSARGNHKPYTDLEGNGVAKQVSGELDLLGNPWSAHEWASAWGARTWASSPWAPVTTVAEGWATAVPPEDAWPGAAWDESSWSAKSWRDAEWTPENWTAKSWRDANWNSFGGALAPSLEDRRARERMSTSGPR